MLLLGKHELDTRVDFRFRAAFRLLAMVVADEAILAQERLVGSDR
jgi:hypothetical protein